MNRQDNRRKRLRTFPAAIAASLLFAVTETATAQVGPIDPGGLIDRRIDPIAIIFNLLELLIGEPCAGHSDGTYCGPELVPTLDPSARYLCQNGQTAATALCSQGCENGACRDPGGGVQVPTL